MIILALPDRGAAKISRVTEKLKTDGKQSGNIYKGCGTHINIRYMSFKTKSDFSIIISIIFCLINQHQTSIFPRQLSIMYTTEYRDSKNTLTH